MVVRGLGRFLRGFGRFGGWFGRLGEGLDRLGMGLGFGSGGGTRGARERGWGIIHSPELVFRCFVATLVNSFMSVPP